jgi:hypothetical protein
MKQLIRYNFYKKLCVIFLLTAFVNHLNAQTGLNFQGVARTSNNIVIASQDITLKLSILQGSPTGITEYIEVRKVTTNAQGLFTAVIGDKETISTIGNFSDIDWKLNPKFLKIEIDPAAGNNFITMGTTQFQYVAYAMFANSVLAENISGIVPVARGGTGSNSLTTLKSSLSLDKVSNTADSSKPISISTQTALDLKLNRADSAKAYVTPAQLSKFNFSTGASSVDTTNISNRINLKLNISDTASLLRKSDTSGIYNRINLKLNSADTTSLLRKSDTSTLSNRINLKLNSADTANLFNRINLKLNSTDTTIIYNKINLKLNSTDTANLSNRINLKLNINDTASLLRKSDTTGIYNRINLKLNSADTASLLRKSDTTGIYNRINLKLNSTDTVSLLRKTDTSTLSNRINLKFNITDTTSLFRKSQVGVYNGAASLDANGKIPSAQIPAISFSSVDVVNSQSEMLAFTTGTDRATDRLVGSIVVRLDSSKNFVLANLPASNRANWVELVNPTNVQVVNGVTGTNIVLTKSNFEDLKYLDNTSDKDKPVSDATKDSLRTRLYITDTSLLLKKSDTSFLLQKVDTAVILAMYAKKFTKDVKINGTSLGKYANGATIPAKGKTLDEFLEDLVSNSIPPTFYPPSVSIGANPGFGNYEIGYVPGLVTLNNTYTQNNGGAVTSALYYKDGSSTPLTAGNSITLDTLKTAVSFRVVVNYAKGTGTKPDNLGAQFDNTITAGSISSSNSYTPYSKRFWGGITTPFLENQTYKIEDFSPSSDQNGSNKAFSFNFTPSGRQYIFVAYLASNAADITKVTWGSLDYTFTKSLVWFENARGYKQLYKIFTSTETYDAGITGISTQ